jgi:hypothetical protein
MSHATDALKRLDKLARQRARADVHTERDAYAVLDVDYLYRLALERQARLGDALRADGDLTAAIDEAYVARVWDAAADVAIALAYLADRVTPHGGAILPAVESRMAPANRAERRRKR